MIQFILGEGSSGCWKFNMHEDMKLDEIIMCIEKQFYANEKDNESGN